ncbi:MAG TPA: LacI family transcriptional regulator [Chloroflexi bacterium]|nr:LacI family transcriptional regulator [Chloroflexota bacterium]
MTQKTVTIADVAKKAGVSTMTVSRAINNKGEITEATRQKVLQVAAELSYRPSRIARSLVTRKTMQIGLVVPDITNPFFSQIALGAQNAAWEAGYNLLLLNTMEDLEREEAILDLLEESQVDGVILCSPRLLEAQLENQLTKQAATVLINRPIASEVVGLIHIADEAGAAQAVKHLISGGRRRIAMLNGPPRSFSGQNRQKGYLAALKQAGLPLDPTLQSPCDPTPEGGLTAGAALLKERPEVDALFCYNDLVAVGALQACAALGKRVPQDVAIVGVDDIPVASLISPRLTTLKTPKYEIGLTAVELLLQRLQGQNKQSVKFFEQQLVVRKSAP